MNNGDFAKRSTDNKRPKQRYGTVGGRMIVCQIYDKENSQRKNIKKATEKRRQSLMNVLKNDPWVLRAINIVK